MAKGLIAQRPDWTSQEGAEELARRLDAYWHAQGFPQAQHWAEQITGVRGFKVKAWAVRSNLVGGMPPPIEVQMGPGIENPGSVRVSLVPLAEARDGRLDGL